ncbi:protein kinase [bacterium]|nr:protein kinase [bacterium]
MLQLIVFRIRELLIYVLIAVLAIGFFAENSTLPSVALKLFAIAIAVILLFDERRAKSNRNGKDQSNSESADRTNPDHLGSLTVYKDAHTSGESDLSILEETSMHSRSSGEFVSKVDVIEKTTSVMEQQDQSSTPNNSLGSSNLPAKFGDYVLHAELGRGASSLVFRARRAGASFDVALKVITAKEFQSQFLREMEIVKKLAHPNVVTAFECGTEHNRSFIAMELIEGNNLQQEVLNNGRLNKRTVFMYLFQAVLALEHAHSRGLIHRDIKPANFLITATGNIKLSDLGMARETDISSLNDVPLADHDSIGGTIQYMAPEQAIAFDEADERSDIFSLGTTMIYLLTASPYVKGNSFQECYKNLTVAKIFNQPESGLLTEMEESVFNKMLAYDPDERYQNCSLLRDDLQTVLISLGCDLPKQSVRILIVEDDETDLRLVLIAIKKTNRSVQTKSTVYLHEAIEKLDTEEFDLVLLDLNLPDSTGLETVETFQKQNTNGVPVIVSTGMHDEILEEKCRKLGVIDFVEKDQVNASLLERQMFVALAKYQSSDTEIQS